MERLAVLPSYRHRGIGRALMDFAFKTVKKHGGKKVSIGIINENRVLKNWYMEYGFVETGTRVFRHLPFEYASWRKWQGKEQYRPFEVCSLGRAAE